MARDFAPNSEARFYSLPMAYRATIGAAAIAAFPAPANAAALLAITGAQASATMAFSAQPANQTGISVNGVPITFVTNGGFSLAGALLNTTILTAGGAPLPWQAVGLSGLQVAIGATLHATLANLLALLKAWPDEALAACHYRLTGGGTLLISAAKTGTAGNAIALGATTNSNVTVTPTGGAASAATAGAAAAANLAGGAAPTAGYAVLVEPQPHPIEIQAAWGICRASQTQGTMTLFESDGAILSKVDTATFAAGNTLSASQELARIPFSSLAAATPLVVPPWTGLYAYGSTTQVIDINAAPAGVY